IHAVGDTLVDASHQHSVTLGEGETHALWPRDRARDLVHCFGFAGSSAGPLGGFSVAAGFLSREVSGGGTGGSKGSLLNGISGKISPGFAPALRCCSRM